MPKEFVSKLEEILTAEELVFPPSLAFGKYKFIMPEEAVAHPAKFNVNLVEFLIKNFTKPGDTVLDPMAGTGVLGVIAALHGRNAIQVELEERFYGWMEKARENVEKHPTLTAKGWIVNILGDARRLSELLSRAGFEPAVAITSPPYAETAQDSDKSPAIVKPPRPQDVRQYPRRPPINKYSDNPENIGNLPLGEVSTIITSPPYADGFRHNPQDAEKRIQKLIEVEKRAVERGQKWAVSSEEAIKRRYAQQDLGYGRSEDNIGNLPLGNVDTVITSPPYGESYLGGGDPERRKERLIKAGYDPKDFLGGKARNAILKHYDEVDAVITSPPYAETKSFEDLEFMVRTARDQSEKVKKGEIKGHYMTEKARKKVFQKMQEGRMQSKNNIGNLPLGEIDAVITSPPYCDVDNVKPESEEFWRRAKEEGKRWGSKPPNGTEEKQMTSSDNIGNLKYDNIDAVITSPPYGECQHDYKHGLKKLGPNFRGRKAWEEKRREEVSPENIANLPHGSVDAVITSPPYLKSAESGAGVNKQRKGDVRIGCSTIGRTVEHPDAIDNVRDYGSIEALARGLMTRDGKPTYLSEMLRIYAQMFKVLKPNGLAIVIVKPFIRNKKPVDLPYHTYLLMNRVGFVLEKLYKLRLRQMSFWRTLMYKKHPDLPRLNHEWILVCRKGVSRETLS
jgi:DNA modification methylase